MLIYILYIIFLFAIDRYYKSTSLKRGCKYDNKNFVIITFTILILIFGLRDYTVGADIRQYRYTYIDRSQDYGFNPDLEEYGFKYLCYLFHSWGVPWQCFLFVVSAFILCVLGRFIYEYSSNPFLSIIIFICIGSFTMYLSALRQSIAISICLLALLILKRGYKTKWANFIKYIAFILLVYIATTVHNSAFIFYPMCALINAKIKRKNVIWLILVASCVLLVGGQLERIISFFLPVRYEDYKLLGLNGERHRQNVLVTIVIVLQTLFCLIFNKDVDSSGRYDNTTSLFFIMSCLTIAFSVLGLSNNQIGRIVYYFANANAVLIPRTVQKIKIYNTQEISKIAIIVLCILYFMLSTPGGTLQIDKYKFFWRN